MPPLIASLSKRVMPSDALARLGALPILPVAIFHLAAVAVLAWTETDIVARLLFLFTWALLNFFWLALLRRPSLSAALSLAMIVALVLLSRFKSENLWMTVSFVDIMIIDADTAAFLFTAVPHLQRTLIIAVAIAIPATILLWRLDPYRVRRRTAALGFAGCLAAITGLSMLVPEEPWEIFLGDNYVSKFVRSGVSAASELMTHGLFEADSHVVDRLRSGIGEICAPARKPPHIIMVLDESSFDIRAIPGVKVPEDYGPHFQSFDGKARSFLVEGAGGPTWYAEYNVLTGLSARSFGHFAYFLTRVAAGRVERGLPQALRRCGYKTFSLYPVFGAFLGAKSFQTTTGVEHFMDAADLGASSPLQADSFYYDKALRVIARERGTAPLFLMTYLTANHFPWDYRFRDDLTPGWIDPGNSMPEVDEFIRRQMMSVGDYADFIARLKRDFPNESFLIVRFGDHQPNIAARLISPELDDAAIGRRVMAHDPRYFTTYYAIDAVNFAPADVSSALDTLDAPYLPLVVQEAAGLPLDPSFAEQRKILRRCRGLFYACAGGAEARRFNRMLIDAGLIKHL